MRSAAVAALRQLPAAAAQRVILYLPSAYAAPARAFRTHTCGAVRAADEGRTVDLSGWVHNVRVMGDRLVFLALRDAYGITQVVIEAEGAAPEPWQAQLLTVAAGLRAEAVVHVTGRVRCRPAALVNPRMATGGIEVAASGLRVLSSPGRPLPLVPGATGGPISDETRLEARYLDLRRDVMQRNLRLRALCAHAVRSALTLGSSPPFVEVETPLLVRSSPEGAREFLVPTRARGKWYALAQSPQQYKQLLMVGGVDRYFQLARCFRDEGGRADRQPEFTQVDLEMSFAGARDVQDAVEGVSRAVMGAVGRAARGEASPSDPSFDFRPLAPPLQAWVAPSSPLPRLTFAHCMGVYGSDKPDRRVGMPLYDVSRLAAGWDAAAPALEALRQGLECVRRGAEAPKPHTRFLQECAWQPDVGDSDLSTLSPTVWSVRAFAARGLGAELSRSEGEALLAELQRASGACGLLFASVGEGGMLLRTALSKCLSPVQQAALVSEVGAALGDLLVLTWGAGTAGASAAGTARLAVAEACRMVGLGSAVTPHATDVRLGRSEALAHGLGSALASALPARRGGAGARVPEPAGAPQSLDLFWVTGFPLFEAAGEGSGQGGVGAAGGLSAVHHPFTAPVAEDLPALANASLSGDTRTLLSLRGQHYDLVANGMELGGGSVRLHDSNLQRLVLERALGLAPAEKFGFGMLLGALDSGAPPHAGLALGFDRLVAVLAGPHAAASVRDVIAFPKSSSGADPLTGGPAPVSEAHSREYHVQETHTVPRAGDTATIVSRH
jgi:aspartyl-tRNA synthetase